MTYLEMQQKEIRIGQTDLFTPLRIRLGDGLEQYSRPQELLFPYLFLLREGKIGNFHQL